MGKQGRRSAASSAFVLATFIVQSLYFLNSEFQAVAVQAGLCRTWLKTPKTGFLMSQLISNRLFRLYPTLIIDVISGS